MHTQTGGTDSLSIEWTPQTQYPWTSNLDHLTVPLPGPCRALWPRAPRSDGNRSSTASARGSDRVREGGPSNGPIWRSRGGLGSPKRIYYSQSCLILNLSSDHYRWYTAQIDYFNARRNNPVCYFILGERTLQVQLYPGIKYYTYL